MNNKVLVLLSSYNGEKYLKEQVDSIFNQKNVDVYCLIRDDGSIDNTKTIIRDLKKKYSKLELIEGNNVGFSKSFYCLLEMANKFTYYAFSDQDDVWKDDKLFEAIKHIDNAKPSLYISNVIVTNSKLNPIKNLLSNYTLPTNKYESLLKNPCPGCSMVFNNKAKDLFLRVDKETIDYHDFWMFVICFLFGSVYYDPIPHMYYRQHENNTLGINSNIIKVYKRRFNQLKKITHSREQMAYEIITKYKDMISSDERKAIEQLANYRKNFFNRLSILFSNKYIFREKKENFWFKIHIIIGNV